MHPITARRRAAGLTLEQLAMRLDVFEEEARAWEEGTVMPSPDHAAALCRELDMDFNDVYAALREGGAPAGHHSSARSVDVAAMRASGKLTNIPGPTDGGSLEVLR